MRRSAPTSEPSRSAGGAADRGGLNRLNRERQEVETATLDMALAEALAAAAGAGDNAAIVVTGEGWHPGVVGLVAARLKESFRRPAFAIAFEGETGTGSGPLHSRCRSWQGRAPGGRIGPSRQRRRPCHGGGRDAPAERLAEFTAFLQVALADNVAAARAAEALLVDATLSAAAVDLALYATLDKAGPFGAGNPEPVFVFPAHKLVDVVPVGQGHLRWRAQSGDGAQLEGIVFRAAEEPLGRALVATRGQAVHLAGSLGLDRWNGRERVQLRLLDLAPAQTGRDRL